jgi:hypothetical protein
MHGVFILAAAIALGGAQTAETPSAPRPAAGPWRLTQAGGKVGCTVILTDHAAAAGEDVKFPAVCRRAFPALKDLASWSLDGQGAILLGDAKGQKIAVLAGAAGGRYEARLADGMILRLEPSPAAASPAPLAGMTGAFTLTGAGGMVLCDLKLRANMFGESGRIVSQSCAAGWADKGLAVWSWRQGRLTLMDRDHKPILVLKAGDTGVFITIDTKSDTLTLARKRAPGGSGHEALPPGQGGRGHPLA